MPSPRLILDGCPRSSLPGRLTSMTGTRGWAGGGREDDGGTGQVGGRSPSRRTPGRRRAYMAAALGGTWRTAVRGEGGPLRGSWISGAAWARMLRRVRFGEAARVCRLHSSVEDLKSPGRNRGREGGMRTKHGLWVLLAAMILAPVTAMAQTTTSTGATASTSSTSTSTSSTLTTLTTSTTLAVDDRCLFTGGCPQSEPAAVIDSSAGEQEGVYGGACWRQPPGSGRPGLARCATVAIPDPFPQAPLLVRPGESLGLRFDPPLVPDDVSISRLADIRSPALQTVSAPPTSPTRFRAEFPEGTFILRAMVRFAQGVVPYYFAVTVRGSAPPAKPTTTARLSLTG